MEVESKNAASLSVSAGGNNIRGEQVNQSLKTASVSHSDAVFVESVSRKGKWSNTSEAPLKDRDVSRLLGWTNLLLEKEKESVVIGSLTRVFKKIGQIILNPLVDDYSSVARKIESAYGNAMLRVANSKLAREKPEANDLRAVRVFGVLNRIFPVPRKKDGSDYGAVVSRLESFFSHISDAERDNSLTDDDRALLRRDGEFVKNNLDNVATTEQDSLDGATLCRMGKVLENGYEGTERGTAQAVKFYTQVRRPPQAKELTDGAWHTREDSDDLRVYGEAQYRLACIFSKGDEEVKKDLPRALCCLFEAVLAKNEAATEAFQKASPVPQQGEA